MGISEPESHEQHCKDNLYTEVDSEQHGGDINLDNMIGKVSSAVNMGNEDTERFIVDYGEITCEKDSDLVLPANQLYTWEADGAVRLRQSFEMSERAITLPTLFRETCEKYPDRPALFYKENKEWKPITFSEYFHITRTVAKAFLKLGLERFHTVSILGMNSPEWVCSDIAAIMAGGFASGIYATNSEDACLHCLKTSSTNIAVVENDNQLQKILKIRGQVPSLKAIIQYVGKPTDNSVYSWNDILEIGNKEPDDELDKVIQNLAANQCCTLLFTSGTTSLPKAVMSSHDNMIFDAKMVVKYLELQEGNERYLSYLPLSHAAAQVMDIYMSLISAGTVYFADRNALKGTLVENLRGARPTILFGVPRVWEKLKEGLETFEKKSSRLRQMVLAAAKSVALSHYRSIANGNVGEPLLFRMFRNMIYSKVKESMGLENCRQFICGAAPGSVDLKEYLASYDIPLSEGYGMTETGACHCINKTSDFKLNTSGRTLPGVRTKIYESNEMGSGEVCMYGRNIFMGYLHEREKTKEAIDEDGWLHSGDIGTCDHDSFIKITGREKELLVTSGGENIPPVLIEMALKKELPVISYAVVIGDKKKFLSVLITLKCNIYPETGVPTDELTTETKDWCKSLGSPCQTVSEIIQKRPKQIYESIQEAINRTNSKAISNAQKIQEFVILPRDFSVSSGELGPTMKLVRRMVEDNFKEQIEQIYA